jgi:hypothetical protein
MGGFRWRIIFSGLDGDGQPVEESVLAWQELCARIRYFKPSGPVYFRELLGLAGLWWPLEREEITADVEGAVTFDSPGCNNLAAQLLDP